MTKIKGVLFDLDGVLLDTERIYTKFWDAVEERYPTHIPNFSSVIKGSNLFEILHDHYADENTRQLVTEMLNDFQRSMKYEYFPGAIEFVEQLNKAGIATCIVTSSDQKKMDAVYSQHPGFKAHFDIPADQSQRKKLGPDIPGHRFVYGGHRHGRRSGAFCPSGRSPDRMAADFPVEKERNFI